MNKSIKKSLEYFISKVPVVGKWRNAFLRHSSPGHFYSPIPDLNEVKNNEKRIFNRDMTSLPAIDLNSNEQLSLLEKFGQHVSKFPYEVSQTNKAYRYTLDNMYYTYYDAITYFCFLLSYQPKRVIEIGSGFSSALLLDVNEMFLGRSVETVFIEPFPEMRLNKLTKESDKIQLTVDFVQNIPRERFVSLEAGDILFIDSSHVSKVGSDLNYLMYSILPFLKKGVLIHFHDVHFPFEYPEEWIYKGYCWNESYILRSFLMYNNSFKIIFWNSYLAERHHSQFYSAFKGQNRLDFDNSTAGSIWLQTI